MHFSFPYAIYLKLPNFFYDMIEIEVPFNCICCILLYLRFQCLVLCISHQSWRPTQASPWPAWWARDSLTRNLRSRASRSLCSITYLTLVYIEFLRGKKKTQEKPSQMFLFGFFQIALNPPPLVLLDACKELFLTLFYKNYSSSKILWIFVILPHFLQKMSKPK